MRLTTEQFWNEYGKPKLYPRSITQVGSTIAIDPITEVSGYARYIDFFISGTLTVTLCRAGWYVISNFYSYRPWNI